MKFCICAGLFYYFFFAGIPSVQANPAEYLDFDPAPRPSAMGSAFTGLADDANALLFNPAGLANMGLNLTQATASVGFLSLDQLNNYLAASQQLPPESYLGFYLDHYGVNNLLGTDANGFPISNLQDIELAFGTTYARDFGYHLKAGIGASFLYQNLAGTNARGFGGVDLGFLFVPWVLYDFMVGASIRHLGGFLSWDAGSTQFLIPDLRIGVSDKLFDRVVVLSYDAQWRMGPGLKILHHAGVETLPWKFLALRGGLDDANPTLGAGFYYLNYSLDYSYEFDSNRLGDFQRLSVAFAF